MPPKVSPVLIAHAHAARDNLGDELLVRSIQSGLRDRLPEFELSFVELFQSSDGSAGREIAPARSRESRKRLAEALAPTRALIVGGGELVGPFHEYIFATLSAAAAGKPVHWLGVGGEAWGGRADRYFLKQALDHAKLIASRDPQCTRTLRGMLHRHDIVDGRDLVYAYSAPKPALNHSNTIAVCLRGSERAERTWDARRLLEVALALRGAQENGYTIHLIPFLSNDASEHVGSPNIDEQFRSDEAIAEFVASRLLPERTLITVIGRDVDAATHILSTSSLLVSMRLHALILASKIGVPFIALDYAPKVRHITRLLEVEKFCLLPEECIESLPQLISDLQTEALRTHFLGLLHKNVPALERTAANVFDESARLLLKTISSDRPSRIDPQAFMMRSAQATYLRLVDNR